MIQGFWSSFQTNVPMDMVLYLVILQCVALSWFIQDDTDREGLQYVLSAQIILLVLFWLVYGGYGKDSWDYLTWFDTFFVGNPPTKEWLFWATGASLSRWVPHPWSLKILSGLSVAVMCVCILGFVGRRDRRYAIIGFFVLVLTPSFFLLYGSAVRQGLAGGIALLGILCLYRGRYMLFILSVLVGIFLHQSSVVLSLAGALSMLGRKPAILLLAVSPFASFIAYHVGLVMGVNIESLVPYANKSEGQFHWAKFFMSYAIAVGMLCFAWKRGVKQERVIVAYASMVALSSLFLKFEVPYERLLLFSDLLLPMAVMAICTQITLTKRRVYMVWSAALIAGVVLWTHPCITNTIGYTGNLHGAWR